MTGLEPAGCLVGCCVEGWFSSRERGRNASPLSPTGARTHATRGSFTWFRDTHDPESWVNSGNSRITGHDN